MSETIESLSSLTTACYHEPKVHDHELYFQLSNINLYILAPLTILGLFFNTSALICLYSPPKITSGVFVYLKALLILDHCQLIVTSAALLIPQFCDSHHLENHTFYQLCMLERRFLKYTMPRMELLINTMHAWTIASLSAHRYWKISRPVVSRYKDTGKRATKTLIIMIFIIFIFRSPIFLLELQFKWKPLFRIIRRPETTELLTPYRVIYHSFLDPFFANVLPFLAMSIFSILTLYEIIKSKHFAYNQLNIDGRTYKQIQQRSQQSLTLIRRRAHIIRQKQEFRATISIVLMILLYLFFHSLQIYNILRKWQLLYQGQCPTRRDYIQSHISNMLSMFSSSVNAFIFIAFTNRLRNYVQMLIRKTSRSLSSNSDPPISPKTATSNEINVFGNCQNFDSGVVIL
uniref:G_PROTEIN_RECEP_F1_2 domain-containing protein n=1 Tax=Parastrongyloides trichosuri TaxID=131310 RepID=A0A0N4Z7U8_PARTI